MAGAPSGGGGGKKKARIEIIPLIDVIFFLLATFVLFTLSLNKSEGVKVELPDSVTAVPRDPAGSHTISVLADGTLAWDKEPVTLDEFIDRLQAYASTTNSEGRILINADRNAAFSQVFGYVLSEVRKSNFEKVLIETTVRAPNRSS